VDDVEERKIFYLYLVICVRIIKMAASFLTGVVVFSFLTFVTVSFLTVVTVSFLTSVAIVSFLTSVVTELLGRCTNC
jgi:ascorbate-specific PTS system EIIC-type component UlaA